ncbi:unnamed protein product [Rotaria magnacalcarata]|uniref:F-box domain-containing protein n=1 Tax=Rotaria magnacalcarata TaxID=392030 RepID=A0A819Z630_9BILA|nr:unnamed protein product [Rotaria magnacalcarata]CAF2052696.1 unnamed protein product [Rotaria magnacalcarata]CAF2107230.1 unnamed protein product [Rotaria magnacalcarata]CAF4163803.1 unnamed protein product [Rotaria magnacalcarata]
MSYSSLDILPNDILYEIFGYLSPIDVIESFFSLSKRLSRIIVNEYFWHIRIGDSTMSLSMFNHHCKNVLQLIGGRVVSLRLILINVINGWPPGVATVQLFMDRPGPLRPVSKMDPPGPTH